MGNHQHMNSLVVYWWLVNFGFNTPPPVFAQPEVSQDVPFLETPAHLFSSTPERDCCVLTCRNKPNAREQMLPETAAPQEPDAKTPSDLIDEKLI